MPRTTSERTIVLLIAAVQFVNILDFVIVMPLGPDFAQALHIDQAKIGYIAGAYTGAAAVSGLLGSLFLDAFDRRKALGVAMLGLVLGTAAGGFARGLPSLMAARMLAGLFGGPATSLSFSIIADVIPNERRGRAMSTVMGAFSVAQVFGVPAGLWLARVGGWNLPFFAVAGLGLVLVVLSITSLPPLVGHLRAQASTGTDFRSRWKAAREEIIGLLSRRLVLTSYGMTAVTMLAGFAMIPNISAYVQHNLGLPRDQLALCYGIGGATTIISIRMVGWLVDRFGSFRIGSIGAALLCGAVYGGFVLVQPPISTLGVVGIFVAFMTAMAFRNVSYNTLASKVPHPSERARFTSLQSAIQHASSTLGGFISSLLLTTLPDQRLAGMERVAAVTISLSLLLPLFLHQVEGLVRQRIAVTAGAVPQSVAEMAASE